MTVCVLYLLLTMPLVRLQSVTVAYPDNIHIRSYTSALLNLINEMGKRDKMPGLPRIISLFRNEINKFNDTGARMSDSMYYITLKLLKNHILA